MNEAIMTTALKPDINYIDKVFVHAQEVWDKAKCLQKSKYRATDAYGTKAYHAGIISPSGSPYVGYGKTIPYNGGCIRNGEWYGSEHIPLPAIDSGFEFYHIASWGTAIRKKQ